MLPLIQRILAIVGEMLGIVQQVLGITQTAAQEHTKYAIETIASNGTNVLIHPTYGNSALKAMLDTITSNQSTILTAINSIRTSQGGGDTVILPPTPPPGYGGGSTAAQVWAYVLPSAVRLEDTTADQTINLIYNVAQWLNRQSAHPASEAPFFTVSGEGAHGTSNTVGWARPIPDWTDIRSTDTVLSWLTRTEVNLGGWAYDASSGTCYTYWSGSSGAITRVDCRLSDADLQAIRAGYANRVPGTQSAPVWPGIANVTLGTPVAIANGASSAEVCDGVIVAITAVPSDQGAYTFDTQKSYVHLGQLAFIDDNGEYEDGQNFGFQAGIITPKRMAQAAGFVMRVKGGVTGTVTPWVTA
jgi:hypothetical protein